MRAVFALLVCAAVLGLASADSCKATCCSIGAKWYGYGNYSKLGARAVPWRAGSCERSAHERPDPAHRCRQQHGHERLQLRDGHGVPVLERCHGGGHGGRAGADGPLFRRVLRRDGQGQQQGVRTLRVRLPLAGSPCAQLRPRARALTRRARRYGTYTPRLSVSTKNMLCNCYGSMLYECEA